MNKDNLKKAKGEFRDIIRYSDGRVEVKEWDKNTVTFGMGKLIGILFKDPTLMNGIRYWAIGSGEESWDLQVPPKPLISDQKLVNEFARKAVTPDNISFIDKDGNATTDFSNVIQIDLTFGETEANGVWKEFGIYGGNATEMKDSGIMINHKTHPVIVKDDTMTIQRQMKFTFIDLDE